MTKSPSVKKMWKSYLYIKKKLIKNKKTVERIKLLFSVFMFLSSIVAYWYFINISSTKWYFIKTEREKLNETKFKNEIVSIDIRKLESTLFDNINLDNYSFSTWRIITLSPITSVAMK